MNGEALRPSPRFRPDDGRAYDQLRPGDLLRIRTENYRQLDWEEVYDAFSHAFPGQWAVQFFPPKSELVNDVNCYHLFVLDEEPSGVNIKRR